MAPGVADSKRPIRSRQNFSVLAEYSGTRSEISPSTLPDDASPDSSSEPPHAPTTTLQSTTASAAATDVILLIDTSPLATEAVVHYWLPSLCVPSRTIERLRWGGRSGSNPRMPASPTAARCTCTSWASGSSPEAITAAPVAAT